MSKENLQEAPTTEQKVAASDCVQNPPCTSCMLLRCKTGCATSSCSTCRFVPDRCSLATIMKERSPCCPPPPLCSPKCSPRCLPSSCLSKPSCCPLPYIPPPRCSLPPRCFRCCEITGNLRTFGKCGSAPCCPPPKCDPCCPPPKCDPCCPPPKCDPCCPPPKCDPCCPPPKYKPFCPPLKYDPCCSPLKYDPCCPPPKYDPCCRIPICDPCPPPKCTEEPPKEKTPPPKEQTPPPEDPCPKSPPPVHRCPSDVEAERPKYFTESITGEGTWKQYGVRIQYTDPVSPGTSSTKVGKPLTVTLGLEVKESCCLTGDVITAYMWTHMKTMCNPCGTWKDLPLHFQPDQSSIGECNVKRYVYKSTVTPTEDDVFRLTFNVKWGNIMIWANNYGDDNMVGVTPS